MYEFFSQLPAFRKRSEGLQAKVVGLSHLPYHEAGGPIKDSEFHGMLNTMCGVRLVASSLTRSAIRRATGKVEWLREHQLLWKQQQPKEAELSQAWCRAVTLRSPIPTKSFTFYFCHSFSFRLLWMALSCQAIRSEAWRTRKKWINMFWTSWMILMAMYICPLCWYLTNKRKGF